jgi:gelsolin
MSFLNCRRVNTVYMFAYCAVYQCVDSSQDKYGTAAYKMVELDDKLGGTAVQHREVQGKESTLFQKYFGNHLTYLEGGVESGFHHVECSAAEPHLYKIKGTRKSDTLRLTQEPVRRNSLNTGDVFVLTAGEEAVWIWVGKESNQDEQAKGVEVAQAFCKKGNVIVLNQGVNDNEKEATEFWAFLPGKVAVLGPIKKSVRVQAADEKDNKSRAFVPVLFQIPEQTGGKLRKVATAKKQPVGPTRDMQYLLPRSTLQSKHGYLLDTGFHIFVWLGSQAPTICKANAMPQAHMYFSSFRRPLLPLTVVKERQETDLFQERFHEAGSAGCACVLM